MDPNRPSTSSYQPEEADLNDVIEQFEDAVEDGVDDDEDDTNGQFDGVNVIPHLEGTNGGNYEELGAVRQPNEDEDLVTAINMFMRNEYDYDEFMRVTGGQTLQEELGSGRRRVRNEEGDEMPEEEEGVTTADDEEEDHEEEVDAAEDVEEEVPDDSLALSNLQATLDRFGALPVESRYILTQLMAGETSHDAEAPARSLADALKEQYLIESEENDQPPLKQIKIEALEPGEDVDMPAAPMDEAAGPSTSGDGTRDRDRGKTKRLDALLGQANVLAARGNIADAMELLREVIRQDHKNPLAYQQIATVYEQEGDHQKALQFGLLASHLDPRTPAEDWVHWGDEATKFAMYEEAAVCFDRALHVNSENWKYYEKRIEMLDQLNLRPLAMRTRLMAAQSINHRLLDVDLQWFQDLIRKVAHYYITINDEEKAILALEAFVLRSREFGEDADAQHKTLVGMHLAKNKFALAGKSIISLCKGIKAVNKDTKEPACDIRYKNGTYECLPFPPEGSVEYEVDVKLFPVGMHAHLVICLFHLAEFDQSSDLEQKLLMRSFVEGDEEFLLDVVRAYKSKCSVRLAMKFLDGLAENSTYDHESSANYWYLKGSLDMMQKNDTVAMKSFEKVLVLQPDHIDNRIHLSTLQQKAGLFEKALETLQDYDLENCSSMPDERLLARQADVLFESGDYEQFVKTTRMMLAPHFYRIYVGAEVLKKRRQAKGKVICPTLSNTLRTCALNVVKHTNWERLIKRLGATVEASGGVNTMMTATELHDYCLKLIECLDKMEKHTDALIVCCYAFLHPVLFKAEKTSTFQSLVYYCAIKARCWSLAFEYVRFFYTFTLMGTQSKPETVAYVDMLHKRLFNAMNFVFVNSQNVCYHRFIMRALVKAKDNHALQAISGNNSLITGTYRHAMGEYLRVWVNNKRNPLICLLLALTFTHMSCKKDLSSRHLICVRGIAFMKKYSKVRSCHQEVYYNTARMFHQMSILPLAKHFYDKVLAADPPSLFTFDEEGNEIIAPAVKYDLRKMAAHNLALMYRTSGNDFAAREIYEKYLVV